MDSQLRHCPRCNRDLPLRRYCKSCVGKDNLSTYCRSCRRKMLKSIRRGTRHISQAEHLYNIMRENNLVEIDSSNKEVFEELRKRTGCKKLNDADILFHILSRDSGKQLFEWDGYNYYPGSNRKYKNVKIKNIK